MLATLDANAFGLIVPLAVECRALASEELTTRVSNLNPESQQNKLQIKDLVHTVLLRRCIGLQLLE